MSNNLMQNNVTFVRQHAATTLSIFVLFSYPEDYRHYFPPVTACCVHIAGLQISTCEAPQRKTAAIKALPAVDLAWCPLQS